MGTMQRPSVCISILTAWLLLASPALAVNIPTVPVGNPGNANDPADGDKFSPGIQNFGAVAYDYRIGTTEVTNAQYVDFLNAKAASDPLGLYNDFMGSEKLGGITRSGLSGSFTYAAKINMGDKPVNMVSWYDAIRYTNWLNNGQGNSDTESGAYTLLGGAAIPSNGNSITRNPGATWFLPSQDEWYKAAYHQPAAKGGDIDDYWLYSTASNSAPTIAMANAAGDISNPGTNVANYAWGADWNSLDGNVTTVDSAGPWSHSYYGTADQEGNVWEWNETLMFGSYRVLRGGSWGNPLGDLSSSRPLISDPWIEGGAAGFRVATVPEPTSFALIAVGILGLSVLRVRRQAAH